MGTNHALYDHFVDHEDYIDMYLTSSPQNREFEFQMSSTYDHNQEATADELFHDGKLLPLHLLRPSEITKKLSEEIQYHHSMPLPCHSTTPPSESHKKKLKLTKSSLILAQKLKSSRAYLKTLFQKHVCSDNPENHANCNQGPRNSTDYNAGQRRSFSGLIKWRSPTPIKCSSSDSSSTASSTSSSFSFISNGGHEFDSLRRSSGFRETEASIYAAIAHCKNSREEDQDRKDVRGI